MPPLSNALTLQTDAGQDAQGEDPRGFEGVGGPHELGDEVDEQRPEPGLAPGGDANVQLVRKVEAGRGGGAGDQHPQGQVPHHQDDEPGEPEGAGVLKHPLQGRHMPTLRTSPP